jgi:hypothetical protein
MSEKGMFGAIREVQIYGKAFVPFLRVLLKARQFSADIRLSWLKPLRGRSPVARRHHVNGLLGRVPAEAAV